MSDSQGSLTDRELLELAAKAAGIELTWSSMDGQSPRSLASFNVWNPLTDDGDALRLAVKLQINIKIGDYSICADDERNADVQVFIEGDPFAATRRAIVHAAAALQTRG